MTDEKFEEMQNDKKIKNLISLVILLASLFLGSLFVDIGQMIKGSGYSQKNLNKSDIFEASGKTWVAYSEPAVPITIINDDSCQNCDVSEAVVWLRRVLPTVSTQKISYDSTEGKALIEKFGIKTLPSFIFAKDVDKTDFYTQASVLFDSKNDMYVLKTQDLGLPVGKYLALPQINEGDATFGKLDSNVKMIVYSDYQCPYCKMFYQSLRSVMRQYGDRVAFDYKHMPLEIHPNAVPSALAAECAQEQGKFWEYSDKLFQNQTAWSTAKDTALFKSYARTLGLDGKQFDQCLDDKKFQNKVDADKNEGFSFGISGTPAVFINDQFQNGAVTLDQLKSTIESQLNK